MPFNNFGDILLFKGTEWDNKLVSWFINSEYNHSAKVVNSDLATSITRKGPKIHRLEDDSVYYDYFIHKDITPTQRNQMYDLNLSFSREYSMGLVFTLAERILLGFTQNIRDISGNKKGLTCSARIAKMYNSIGLPVLDGVHYSQITPKDFSLSKYFEHDESKSCEEWF